MIEEFKDIVIPGYEGLYQVSNLGRVRSIKRKIFVKPNVDPAGYWKVCLTNHNHKWRQYAIHRLVASAFIPNPTGFPAVNHKDECKSNNCVDNLEWCTQAYNNRYSKLGKPLSEEHKRKVSESSKGRIKSPEERRKLSESLKGHIVSEESRRKIRESKKGTHSSLATEFKKGHIPWNKGLKKELG